MSSATQTPKYHVVCRECSLERLFDSSADARALKRAHTEETGHWIAVGRVR